MSAQKKVLSLGFQGGAASRGTSPVCHLLAFACSGLPPLSFSLWKGKGKQKVAHNGTKKLLVSFFTLLQVVLDPFECGRTLWDSANLPCIPIAISLALPCNSSLALLLLLSIGGADRSSSAVKLLGFVAVSCSDRGILACCKVAAAQNSSIEGVKHHLKYLEASWLQGATCSTWLFQYLEESHAAATLLSTLMDYRYRGPLVSVGKSKEFIPMPVQLLHQFSSTSDQYIYFLFFL